MQAPSLTSKKWRRLGPEHASRRCESRVPCGVAVIDRDQRHKRVAFDITPRALGIPQSERGEAARLGRIGIALVRRCATAARTSRQGRGDRPRWPSLQLRNSARRIEPDRLQSAGFVRTLRRLPENPGAHDRQPVPRLPTGECRRRPILPGLRRPLARARRATATSEETRIGWRDLARRTGVAAERGARCPCATRHRGAIGVAHAARRRCRTGRRAGSSG